MSIERTLGGKKSDEKKEAMRKTVKATIDKEPSSYISTSEDEEELETKKVDEEEELEVTIKET